MTVRKIQNLSGDAQIVSLDAARIQTRASDCGDDDALLTQLIGAATAAAEDRLQRALLPARYRLTVDRFAPALELLMPPVLAVESVRYVDRVGQWQELDPADYLLDAVREPGWIVPAPGRCWPCTQDRINAVEVTYTAGYVQGSVPEPIRAWVLLALADMYQNPTRSAEKPMVPQQFADGLLDVYRIFTL